MSALSIAGCMVLSLSHVCSRQFEIRFTWNEGKISFAIAQNVDIT
jgi:hypothetical protein